MSNIVLVWAGGTGMSWVAGILYDLWFSNIVCIDAVESQLSKKLRDQGLQVIIGHGKYQPSITDIIIYSEAAVNSPELLAAKHLMLEKNKQMFCMNYFQFLGELSKYFISVGFAGTNGKSSCTALALYTTKQIMPDFWLGIVWALIPDFWNNNYIINDTHKTEIKSILDAVFTGKKIPYDLIKKYYFLVEACEYKRHFLFLDLDYSIITNTELDHTDYYKGIDDYFSAFQVFIEKTKQQVIMLTSEKQMTLENKKIKYIDEKIITFDHLFWGHTNKNWSLVAAILQTITNIPEEKIFATMKSFRGLRRRLECIEETEKWALIFSDYGHIASSINVWHQALKAKYPEKKLIVIFQPHQMNRIMEGRNDFPQAMKLYDEAIIYDIYAARENFADIKTKLEKMNIAVNNVDELWIIFAEHCWAIYTKEFSDITKKIDKADQDTIIIFFSAWDLDYKIRCRKYSTKQ